MKILRVLILAAGLVMASGAMAQTVYNSSGSSCGKIESNGTIRNSTVPSLSSLPMLDPELLRIVPSLSILPILEPLLLRMVPSLSNLPTLDPLLLRMVPLLSILPQLEPLLL